MIGINMDKAKEIWRNKVRNDRQPQLDSLDIQYLKATEAQNVTLKNYIEIKKQELRDAPADNRISEATSPEELKNIDPVSEIMSISEFDQAKLDKLQEIDQAWKITLNNGWQTPEGWSLGIHTDDVALLNGAFALAKEASSLGSVDPIVILDTEGEPHELTLEQMVPLMLAYGQARSALSTNDASRRRDVKNATTIEELEAI